MKEQKKLLPLQQQAQQIRIRQAYNFNVLLIVILFYSCTSSTNRNKEANTNTATQITNILIGYDSLPVALGDNKNNIDKLIVLKWDKDNGNNSELIGYYSPMQTVSLYKLKGNLDLYFTFNKKDSTLERFSSSLVFDNYERGKITYNIREELLKKFSKMIDFSLEEITSGKEKVKKYNYYEVKIKLDTSSYSPTFYYTIGLLKE